jgi:hypothetical protein
MLRRLTSDVLRELLAVHDRTCVSILLPTHRFGPEAAADAAQGRRLLADAEAALAAAGRRAEEIDGLLAPVRELFDDPSFWRSQGESLALFAAAGTCTAVRLDAPAAPAVEVGMRFHLSPLVAALPAVERFRVLALTLERPRLLEVTAEGVRRLQPPAMPSGIGEALGYDEYDSGLQVHSAGPAGAARQPPIVHGHGGDDDDERAKKDVLQYFRQVARALDDLPDAGVPVVLASVVEHAALFREAGGDGVADRLAPVVLSGSPERVPDDELAVRARALLAEGAETERDRALSRYREIGARERAASDPEVVVTAASEGRIETLFLVPGTRRWGTFDRLTHEVRLHAIREPGDDDLAELAVTLTLEHGGAVVPTTQASAPDGAPLAAILRY